MWAFSYVIVIVCNYWLPSKVFNFFFVLKETRTTLMIVEKSDMMKL